VGAGFAEQVIMKISEYEEQFQRPGPSWHQIVIAAQSPNRTRRRWLVAVALIAAMMLTMGVGPRYVAAGHARNGSTRKQAFDVLSGDLQRIPDLVRDGWTDGSSETARSTEPLSEIDR